MSNHHPSARVIDLDIQPQPDDSTCGPTCLHALYRHFGDEVSLDEVVDGVPQLDSGGTLAVHLANHALRRGYRAHIFTYNLTVFDPSWFAGKAPDLSERLREQARLKGDARLRQATEAYLEFLSLGGEIAMEDLSPDLLLHRLEQGRPILAGLSATFLYRTARETGTDILEADDLRGRPTGHFVLLCGWDPESREIRLADPLADRPEFLEHVYWIPVERVINSVLLGVLSYDANMLLLEPPGVAG
jgi:hypothetical protein